MGMKVTCRYCKSKVEKKDAFTILGEKHNTYYCNKECYSNAIAEKEKAKKEAYAEKRVRELERLAKKQEKEKQKEEQKAISAARKAKRDAVYDELCDIFGYEVQNSVLFTEWILWNKLADDEKILAYLKENKEYIKNAYGRASGAEYAKIRYVSAILKNRLKDYSNNRGKWAQMPVIDDAAPKENVVDTDYIMPTNKKKKTERRKGFGE